MAYERTNWQNGDVISSEKLNKMEAGIEYACSLEHEVEDPTEGQVLKYDAEKGKFVNADVPAAIETNIQNPTDGQTLKYDAAKGKWVNAEGGSGGSSTLVVTVTYDESTQTSSLNKTWQEIYDAMPNVVILDELDDGVSLEIPLLVHFDELMGGAKVQCVSSRINGSHTYTSSSKTGVLTDGGSGPA